jgi:hypothetical protein
MPFCFYLPHARGPSVFKEEKACLDSGLPCGYCTVYLQLDMICNTLACDWKISYLVIFCSHAYTELFHFHFAVFKRRMFLGFDQI